MKQGSMIIMNKLSAQLYIYLNLGLKTIIIHLIYCLTKIVIISELMKDNEKN